MGNSLRIVYGRKSPSAPVLPYIRSPIYVWLTGSNVSFAVWVGIQSAWYVEENSYNIGL